MAPAIIDTYKKDQLMIMLGAATFWGAVIRTSQELTSEKIYCGDDPEHMGDDCGTLLGEIEIGIDETKTVIQSLRENEEEVSDELVREANRAKFNKNSRIEYDGDDIVVVCEGCSEVISRVEGVAP